MNPHSALDAGAENESANAPEPSSPIGMSEKGETRSVPRSKGSAAGAKPTIRTPEANAGRFETAGSSGNPGIAGNADDRTGRPAGQAFPTP